MHYVFASREESGDLMYYIDAAGRSIFKFASAKEAKEALQGLYIVNPDFELFKLLPASAALCEC